MFGRLKAAQAQANVLKDEIAYIRAELATLSKKELFVKYVSPINENKRDAFEENNTDEPSAKKCKNIVFNRDDNGFVIVYTDGACEGNGQKNAKAGIGVWFGQNHPL